MIVFGILSKYVFGKQKQLHYHSHTHLKSSCLHYYKESIDVSKLQIDLLLQLQIW